MNSCITNFNQCLQDLTQNRANYSYLKDVCNIPEEKIQDLLRAEIVNVISAMDHFIHEMVRIRFVISFHDPLLLTNKAKTVVFNVSTIKEIIRCQNIMLPILTSEDLVDYWINKEFANSLKTQSFQKTTKIKEALSYIWKEEHKIQAIVSKMIYFIANSDIPEKQKFLERKIDLITDRRNQIVHEADYDIVNRIRQQIDVNLVDDAVYFVKDFVYSIFENITGDTTFDRL